MRHYRSPSMKPTQLITNHSVFGKLDLGPVAKSKKRRAKGTTTRYRDSSGKPRFSGNKTLKTSQKLCSNVCQVPKLVSFSPHISQHLLCFHSYYIIYCYVGPLVWVPGQRSFMVFKVQGVFNPQVPNCWMLFNNFGFIFSLAPNSTFQGMYGTICSQSGEISPGAQEDPATT